MIINSENEQSPLILTEVTDHKKTRHMTLEIQIPACDTISPLYMITRWLYVLTIYTADSIQAIHKLMLRVLEHTLFS